MVSCVFFSLSLHNINSQMMLNVCLDWTSKKKNLLKIVGERVVGRGSDLYQLCKDIDDTIKGTC